MQTCLAQSESARPKTNTCMGAMSLFNIAHVACLLITWQRASRARSGRIKDHRLDHATTLEGPALSRQLRCHCNGIEVHQLPALSQHPCKILCPGCSDIKIAAEIKVSQRWALRQHSCKPLRILSFRFTARQLDVLMRHWAVNAVSCQERTAFSGCVIAGVVPEDHAQVMH